MKKAFKIIIFFIGGILVSLLITGHIVKAFMKPTMNETYQKAKFIETIQKADKDCPFPTALDGSSVTGIKLEDGFVTYYITYEHDSPVALRKNIDEETVKEPILMCILCTNAQGGNRGDLMMDMLIHFNYGIRVIFKESATKLFECSATADEIKIFRQRYQLNPHEALYNLLTLTVESERESLPMVIDEGMVMTDYLLDSDNIVFVIEVDEKIYSLENIYTNLDFIKASVLQNALNDRDGMALLDICKLSHTGLNYKYRGKRSRKEVDLVISSDEIRRIVKTPEVLKIQ